MASLHGLPPLPKSLSGLMQFSSAQWKEMERIHTMRTMIQQDLGHGSQNSSSPLSNGVMEGTSARNSMSRSLGGSHTLPHRLSRTSRLDAQLALLRKEMVGLRQLDMSLLCQLWSLNESIHEYKQIVRDKLADSYSAPLSPGWEHNLSQLSSDDEDEYEQNIRRNELPKLNPNENSQKLVLQPAPRKYRYHMRRISSSSSSSSFEFGNT